MFTIQSSAVLEGSEFRVLARIVGTDKTVLGSDAAGPLRVEIFTASGALVYTKDYDEAGNGIIAAQVGSGWTRPGVFNFSFTFSPTSLAQESPPFAFHAPDTYRIVFTHLSTVYGGVKTVAIVPIS